MSATNINDAGDILPTSAKPQNTVGTAKIAPFTSGTVKNDMFYGTGADVTLAGGAGDDTYYVYGSEHVVESPGQGVDTVSVWKTSYTLPDNVENLFIHGVFKATGNNKANIIIGDTSGQTINGAGGDDVLTGGGGVDTFVFDQHSGRDVISDFTVSTDLLNLTAYRQFTSLSQVRAALTQVGADTILRLDASDSVTLRGVQSASLTSANLKLALDTSQMHLTFSDEFDSLSLRTAGKGVWRTDFGYGGSSDALGSRTLTSNAEMEIYVDPNMKGKGSVALGINPFSVSNGVLTITAAPTPDAAKSALYNYQYTSGLLTTQNSFAQEYGYFEVRAKLPDGKGAWPAFWLLPAAGGWPPELDVMEAWGGNLISQTSHSKFTPMKLTQTNVPGATSGFHTYGMLWDADHITWYIDGVTAGQIDTPADMHQKMYMLLNLAVAKGTAAAVLPAEFEVDYVHAYSLPDSSSTSVTASLASGSDAPTTSSGSSSAAQAASPLTPSSSSAAQGASAAAASITTAAVDSDHSPPQTSSTTLIEAHASSVSDLATELQNLSRAKDGVSAASLAAHGLTDFAAVADMIPLVISGSASVSSAEAKILDAAESTISVAAVSYDFFTGATPTSEGLDYLVSSTANANDLSDPYYSQFNTQNRFINFAVALATGKGAGATDFLAKYGQDTLSSAATKLYSTIFGVAPDAGKIDQILQAEVSDGHGGTETRAAYLADLAGSASGGLGAKAALAGWLLVVSLDEKLGPYYEAESHFVQALAHGSATFNVNLLDEYGSAAPLVGAPHVDSTLVG